jgi:acyl-CoA dehydrogenase
MDFSASEEQRLISDALSAFVEREMYPHEAEVERLGTVPDEIARDIVSKAVAAGFYALNMPEAIGGGGLDNVTLAYVERELGKPSLALSTFCSRPAPNLLACQGDQIETYLKPTVRGERRECFALTEPGAGSDVMAITTSARQDGDDYVINGTKQFITHADHADFIILFAVTGTDDGPRGPRKRITSFLIDKDTPGVSVALLDCVSVRGYHPTIITLEDVRVSSGQVLGVEGGGFDVANEWLYAGRVMLGASCTGRAERVLDMCLDWAASRKQFGQTIGKFQGVSFKLADMAMETRAAWLLTLECAWKLDQGTMSRMDASMVNLFASEMIGRVTDNAVQIFGGMGLMTELPIERFWRDARVERIWEGTSEIHRHVISRDLLRDREA